MRCLPSSVCRLEQSGLAAQPSPDRPGLASPLQPCGGSSFEHIAEILCLTFPLLWMTVFSADTLEAVMQEENMVAKTIGFNWGPAGTGCSEWTGVRLVDVLQHCGMQGAEKSANYVCFRGPKQELPQGKSMLLLCMLPCPRFHERCDRSCATRRCLTVEIPDGDRHCCDAGSTQNVPQALHAAHLLCEKQYWLRLHAAWLQMRG